MWSLSNEVSQVRLSYPEESSQESYGQRTRQDQIGKEIGCSTREWQEGRASTQGIPGYFWLSHVAFRHFKHRNVASCSSSRRFIGKRRATVSVRTGTGSAQEQTSCAFSFRGRVAVAIIKVLYHAKNSCQ
jgi:hypothetical protein